MPTKREMQERRREAIRNILMTSARGRGRTPQPPLGRGPWRHHRRGPGVILNLAVVFGAAVFVPRGEIDLDAVGLAAVALLILLRWRVDVQWVVLGGAVCGLLGLLI